MSYVILNPTRLAYWDNRTGKWVHPDQATHYDKHPQARKALNGLPWNAKLIRLPGK